MAKRHAEVAQNAANRRRAGNGDNGDFSRKKDRDKRRQVDNHTTCEHCGHYANEVVMTRRGDVFFCGVSCMMAYAQEIIREQR